MPKISLYECFNAKVMNDKIYCAKGHHLCKLGKINLLRLKRGNSLIFKVCQNCSDFDRMGEPIPLQERGWI